MNDYEDEEADENEEIDEEAYFVTPGGSLGGLYVVSQYQKVLFKSAEYDEVVSFIRDHSSKEHYWPSVYFISDHGNIWPISDIYD